MKFKKFFLQHLWLIIICIFLAIGVIFLIWYDFSKPAEAANSLEIALASNSVKASRSALFSVTAKDVAGNTDTDYTGLIHFSTTDATATLPDDYKFLADDKTKAIYLYGWNPDLMAGNYSTVVTKSTTNNINQIIVGVSESDAVGHSNFFITPKYAFADGTFNSNYNLDDLLNATSGTGIEVYAWITCFGPEWSVNIDGDSNFENAWINPSSATHQAHLNSLISYLLTNYAGAGNPGGVGLAGIILDYVRYPDIANTNENDGDNIDEAQYRLYTDGGAYTDYNSSINIAGKSTIITDFVSSVKTTVQGFQGKKLGVNVYPAHNQNLYADWVVADLGQDYGALSNQVDYLSPLAYHIGWYEASWVGGVIDFVKQKIQDAGGSAGLLPTIQLFISDTCDVTAEPGADEINSVISGIDTDKIAGLWFFEYEATSDEEWTAIKNSLDDNGSHNFSITFNRTGSYNLNVVDTTNPNIAGSLVVNVIGIHPNGSIVTSTSTNKVYYLEEGQKRWIVNASIFNQRFRWRDIIWISPSELATYPDGSNIYYPDGVLITSPAFGPKVYVIEAGQKRWIQNPAIFNNLGYKWENIKYISASEIVDSIYPPGPDINSADIHPNGSIVTASGDPKVYVLEEGQKRWIVNPTVFNLRYRWERLIWINLSELNSYPVGNNITYPDGSLVTCSSVSPKVYVVEADKRRWITSAANFNSLGYQWSNINFISPADLALFTDGIDID